MNYIIDIKNYNPKTTQEEVDKEMMLKIINNTSLDLLTRDNLTHLTASAWITNKTFDKILIGYHNLYQSYGWLGGHADGISDMSVVAVKECMEESGLSNIKLYSDKPISLEILPVNPHIKKNKFVSAHLHLNLTYLIIADDKEETHIKPDENSSLLWVSLDEAVELSTEEIMKPIYIKLNNYIRSIKNIEVEN